VPRPKLSQGRWRDSRVCYHSATCSLVTDDGSDEEFADHLGAADGGSNDAVTCHLVTVHRSCISFLLHHFGLFFLYYCVVFLVNWFRFTILILVYCLQFCFW